MTVSPTLASALGAAADAEIQRVLMRGGGGVSVPAGEVAAVAAVVLGGVPRIAAAWKPILAGKYSCSITGVFVHGSPKVDFTDNSGVARNCELGDLLIVIDEIKGSKILDRRANLVQAKLTPPPGGFVLGSGGAIQLDLYRNWHAFTFTSKKTFARTPRDFNAAGTPASLSESGKFGGIDLVSGPRRWGQTVPSASMSITSSLELGTFMASMATGGGSGRLAIPGGTDDWSSTIDELLLVSLPLLSSFGAIISTKKARGVSAVAMQTQNPTSSQIYFPISSHSFAVISRDPPPPPDEKSRPSRDSISVIYIMFEANG